MRDFDFVMQNHDVLVALGGLAKDVASQLPTTVVGGLVAAQSVSPSLSITIGSGRIYQFAPADSVAAGSIPQDLTSIVQQGYNAGQTLTLVAPSSGQSQWNLIQAQFSQVDSVRVGDPNGGIVPFYNAANPTQPTTQSINTTRRGLCVLQVVTGSAATTGTEVPPQPTSGWVPLYLIDLVGGQSQIITSQILTAGPSVGTGVPSNYPYAPFLAGLLASHHSGNAGQAPKIKLASEVQGILPYANMSSVRTLLNASLILYVNGTTGADVNAGLTPQTAFKTIQAAVNSGSRNYDFNGNGFTISVANGTYTGSGPSSYIVNIGTQPVGLNGTLNLVGNISTPGGCIIASTNGNGVLVNGGAQVSMQGFTVTASGTNTGIISSAGFGINCQSGSYLNIANCTIGSCGSIQLQSAFAALVVYGSGMTFTGTTQWSTAAVLSGTIWIVGVAVTYSALTVSTANWYAAQGATINSSSVTSTGTVTGPRYLATLNGTISTATAGGATYVSGSVAGSTSLGGIYS